MKGIFNIIGAALLAAAAYYGAYAFIARGLAAEAAGDRAGGLAVAYNTNLYLSLAQTTLIALMASGVFLGFAAVLQALSPPAAADAGDGAP